MLKSHLIEFFVYKNPNCIREVLNLDEIKKVYMQVKLKNGLKRDLVIETSTDVVLIEVMLKGDTVSTHVDYLEKDVNLIGYKHAKCVILTDYPLSLHVKYKFRSAIDGHYINLYNIIIDDKKNMKCNGDINVWKWKEIENIKFNDLVNSFGKNTELVEVIEYIRRYCFYKNFHNFAFCNEKSQSFGSGVEDLNFYISADTIALKFSTYSKFNRNKNVMNNILNTVGAWRENKTHNGIYIPAKKTKKTINILNRTIEFLDDNKKKFVK
ncbi:hypothetical protein [Clostridium hydrogenum]|uniref:hypothetical protein n=1 Tax=Clostridium hydrogenum TaxID=2855764 RepID=UPI001F1A2DA4|nr:hypothetical protein [Clostridium hydrogenum]